MTTSSSMESIGMDQIVTLGQVVQYLDYIPRTDINSALSQIRELRRKLENLGLTEAVGVAQPLFELTVHYDKRNGIIREGSVSTIRTMMNLVRTAIYREAQKRLMITLKRGDVSPMLRSLPSVLELNSRQEHLLEETIRSLEVEAYRSAAVMGWNLAYDYIRQWVFDNQLDKFNSELAKRGAKVTLKEYDDFFESELGEFDVLEISKKSGIIGGRVHDDLKQYLRLRNSYAHASQFQPSSAQVNAYIEYLIDTITKRPPFCKTAPKTPLAEASGVCPS